MSLGAALNLTHHLRGMAAGIRPSLCVTGEVKVLPKTGQQVAGRWYNRRIAYTFSVLQQ